MAFGGMGSAWCPWYLAVSLALLPLEEKPQETQAAFANLFVRKRLAQDSRWQKHSKATKRDSDLLVPALLVLETTLSKLAPQS